MGENMKEQKLGKRVSSLLLIWMLVCVGFVGISLESDEVRAVGPTEVSGIISTDTTWTLANSPYIVTGNILVEENINLTIEPGVTVKFNTNIYLRIDGTILAKGTESQMITFTSNKTSPAPSDWGGIRITSISKDSIFKYCRVKYGGGENGGGFNNAANNLQIFFCKIENNSAEYGGGIYNSGSVNIDNCKFIENFASIFGGGINNQGMATITYCSILRNIASNGGGGGIYNSNSAISSIIECVILENSASGTNGGGGIFADGSSNITSCEINNNSAFWGGGIYKRNLVTSLNLLNCTISQNLATYGGGINIFHAGFTNTTINYCNISYNSHYGISGNCSLISNSTIKGNLGGGIQGTPSSIEYSNLANPNYNIYLSSSSDVKAKYNWWGTTNTDSINQSIYDNYDDSNLGIVNYKPFLTSPVNLTNITPPNRAPIANAGPDQNAIVNQTVNFDGSGSNDPDGDPLTYKWDFGDGTGTGWQNASNASHSYKSPGNYTVTLTVSDGSLTDSGTCIGQVRGSGSNNIPPIANAGPDQETILGETVYFDGSKSYDPDFDPDPLKHELPIEFQWDFGDGITTDWDGGPKTSHKYNVPGNYSVTLMVRDGESTGSDICYIKVLSKDEVNGTVIGGIISSDATWNIYNSPYFIMENTLIEENVNLTIEPGVVIKFIQDKYLRVDGTLYAVGKESQLITFTGIKKFVSYESPNIVGDNWKELRFTDKSKNSIIKYCKIEYSENGITSDYTNLTNQVDLIISDNLITNNGRSIYLEYSSCKIFNNVIKNNNGGINLEYGNSIIMNNTITNSGEGIFLDNHNSLITNNTISTNLFDGIRSYDSNSQITNNIISNNNYTGIICTGSSIVENNQIIDNVAFGITCSGDAQVKNNYVANNWYGIQCSGNAQIEKNSIVKNKGYGILCNSGSPTISFNEIKNNNWSGVFFRMPSSPKIEYNNITSNKIGLNITSYSWNPSGGSPFIKNNNLNDNTIYIIYNNQDEQINITNNWWGTTNVNLIKESIYDYYDDFEKGKVIYKPFLTSPVDISYQPPPENLSNQPPVANAGLDQYVKLNQTVYFDGSGSYDPDGDTLTYKWSFGDGTSTGWQNGSKASHKYNLEGKYSVELTVSDGESANSDTCLVFVGDQQNASSPKITSSNIQNNSQNISINNSQLKITFSTPMNRSSVESALSISPKANYTLYWGKDNTELLIIFNDKLSSNTKYTITIDATAKDRNGNNLNDPFKLVFTTGVKTKTSDNNEKDYESISFFVIIVLLIIIIIILAFIITNRRRLKEKHTSDRKPFDDRQKFSGDINIEEYSVDDSSLNEPDKFVNKLLKEALSVKKPSDFNLTEEEMLNQAKIKYRKGEISKTTYVVVESKLTK